MVMVDPYSSNVGEMTLKIDLEQTPKHTQAQSYIYITRMLRCLK